MNDSTAQILVGAGSFIVGLLISVGVTRATIAEHERRMGEVEDEQRKQSDRFHALNDVFVSYRHFSEVMAAMRETQQDLKTDMKKVLEILSVHRV